MNIISRQWLSLVTTNKLEDEIIELLKKNEAIIYRYPITKSFNHGTFEILSIGNLRASNPIPTNLSNSVNADFSSDEKNAKKIAILTLYVRSPENLKGKSLDMHKWFDTSSLQIHLPELADTHSKKPILYQVASNFNCQENGTVYTSLTSNHYLSNLMIDSTQGPSASAGAGLGAIERLRYHLNNPINLLSAFAKENAQDPNSFIEVRNGKITNWSHDIDVSKLDVDNVKIGVHSGVSANFDRSNRKCCYFYERGVPIYQVFVSTICIPDKKKIVKTDRRLAAFLLKAAYDGTYLAARSLESRKLVLTFIGGGVFNNPFELIIEAIVNAHLGIDTEYLDEVILPIFDPSVNHLEVMKLLEHHGLPKELIRVKLID
jgi:hypothetical protein